MADNPRETVASAARTVTGTSGAIVPAGFASEINLAVSVTAVAGTTPTLDLTVEWSNDGVTWFVGDPADSFTQITAVAAKVKQFLVKAAAYRVKWTIAGTTPSFTFSVTEFDTP